MYVIAEGLTKSNFYYSYNLARLLEQFLKVLRYIFALKNHRVIYSIYDNMLETLKSICNNKTILTDNLKKEIESLLKNYEETFEKLINDEKEKYQEEIAEKMEIQDNYLSPKIRRINDVLKDIQNETK